MHKYTIVRNFVSLSVHCVRWLYHYTESVLTSACCSARAEAAVRKWRYGRVAPNSLANATAENSSHRPNAENLVGDALWLFELALRVRATASLWKNSRLTLPKKDARKSQNEKRWLERRPSRLVALRPRRGLQRCPCAHAILRTAFPVHYADTALQISTILVASLLVTSVLYILRIHARFISSN